MFYFNRCTQWDVNNGNLHGDYFEQHTGDVNITKKMFEQVRDADEQADLYLNDFGIISNTASTSTVVLSKLCILFCF